MRNGFRHAGALFRHPALLVLAFCVLVYALHAYDTRWRYVPFTLSVTAFAGALVLLVSRRPFFAFWCSASIVLALAAASDAKFRLKGFSLHVFDVAFTGADLSALSFLAGSYGALLVAGLGILLAGIFFLALAFWSETPIALPVRWRGGLAVVTVACMVVLYPHSKGLPGYVHYIAGYNASAFFVSLGDVQFPLSSIALAGQVARAEAKSELSDGVSCGSLETRPDLFVVLSESQTNPGNFPQIDTPDWLNRSFASDDGKIHPMQVETFGGGTWVTNFSVLTGLSSADFGWQSPYVTQVLEGRVKSSLPQLLKRCGYRTVAVLPMEYSFVNEGPFLTSIGFDEVIDQADIAPESNFARDNVYFTAAEKVIREHRKTDGRPLFLAMQTMFSHGPYDMALEPDASLDAGTFSKDAEANEYMRRIALAREDLEAFQSKRKLEPGPRGSVVLEFGDHQGTATKPYVEAMSKDTNVFEDFGSLAYKTYYSIHGYGRAIDMEALSKPIDVGFLPASLIEAAGLPTSPMFEALAELRDACGGKYHKCPDRHLVDAHLKERSEAGLLDLD